MNSLPRMVSFGEALTDFIRRDDDTWLAIPGGAPWNLARVTVRLGVQNGFAGSFSHDVFGDDILSMSQAAGLDERFLQRVHQPPLLAFVMPNTRPQYFFVGENSADLASDPDDLPIGWLNAAELLHFGALSMVCQPLAQSLLRIAIRGKEAGQKNSFGPNYRTPMEDPSYGPTFRTMVEISDFIKVSEEDIEGLFPELDRASALATIRRWSPSSAILITDGPAGMTLHMPFGEYFQPAFRIALADTIGCGDAAMGGWLASLLIYPDAAPEGAYHIRGILRCGMCCSFRGVCANTS